MIRYLTATLCICLATPMLTATAGGHHHGRHRHNHSHHGGASLTAPGSYIGGYSNIAGVPYGGYGGYSLGGYGGYGYGNYGYGGYAFDPYRSGSFHAPDLLDDPYFRAQHKFDSQFPGRYSRRPPL